MEASTKKNILVLYSNPVGRKTLDLPKAIDSTKDLRAINNKRFFEQCINQDKTQEIINVIRKKNPALTIIFLCKESRKTIGSLLPIMREVQGAFPTIVLVDWVQSDESIDLLRLNAEDILTKPIDIAKLLSLVRKFLSNEDDDNLTKNLRDKLGLRNLIGSSKIFLSELKKVPAAARSDATVLITGETGSGKELFARAIHYLSKRSEKPFITVNCGAIPSELAENELFGHVRGAFTGATSSEPGLVEEANHGSLFLDEIDCLSLVSQVKLLRFLQDKEYKRLGSTKVEKANVRTIAAGRSDLESAVDNGRFREDLFYRLNVIRLNLSPLRERKEDIPILALHFLKLYAFQFKKEVHNYTSGAMELLLSHDWPGNIRELENTIERSVVFCNEELIQENDITIRQHHKEISKKTMKEVKSDFVKNFEKEFISNCLRSHKGNISKAAADAGKDRRAFWELMRRYQIRAQDFRN